MAEQQEVTVCHLGHVPYEPTWELQRRIQDTLISRRKGSDPPVHVLLLLEHPPVFTLGRNGSMANLLLSRPQLEERGASFHHIDRGGDITYHGPGQLVGYPILDLNYFFTDIHRYLRLLEETMIRTCRSFGVEATRVEGRTGTWIQADARGPERKICAMGIRASRWVTMHGFALNINTDLSFFDAIVPCGIRDRGVTSLAVETGCEVDESSVRETVSMHFADCFDARTRYLVGSDAFRFLADLLPQQGLPSGLVEERR